MQYLDVDIGGRPGVDCRGFCEFCYFKRAKITQPFGCRYCPPSRIGCKYCKTLNLNKRSGFRPLWMITSEAMLKYLSFNRKAPGGLRISGGGDVSCYPKLYNFLEICEKIGIPIRIAYTSGKGFNDPGMGKFLVQHGLSEIDFSVFSVDPDLRAKYIHDSNPRVSLSILEYLCNEIDVFAGVVVLPGINDGDVLIETCEWLEERGAKGLILMRFGNTEDQGLIFGNAPIIPGVEVQSVKDFRDMVKDLAGNFKLKINGSPGIDTEFDSPFAIRNKPDLLNQLPRIEKHATVISGNIAAPHIQCILDACGFESKVIAMKKEIACLINSKDLHDLDLSQLEKIVIIPGRALVHNKEAESIICADGEKRVIIRGPNDLTADTDRSMDMTWKELCNLEMTGFKDLISLINEYGV